jgi:hypothetical protein
MNRAPGKGSHGGEYGKGRSGKGLRRRRQQESEHCRGRAGDPQQERPHSAELIHRGRRERTYEKYDREQELPPSERGPAGPATSDIPNSLWSIISERKLIARPRPNTSAPSPAIYPA